MRHSRSPQACSPTAAISSREPATRRRSGGSSTRPPSPLRPLPTAWAVTPRHTPYTPACDPSALQPSSPAGIQRQSCQSMARLARVRQPARAARRRAQNTADPRCTWLSQADCTGCVTMLAMMHEGANGSRVTTAQPRAKADKSPSQSLRSSTCLKASCHCKKASKKQRASSMSPTTITRTRSLSWR
jgi:hypothetical protein